MSDVQFWWRGDELVFDDRFSVTTTKNESKSSKWAEETFREYLEELFVESFEKRIFPFNYQWKYFARMSDNILILSNKAYVSHLQSNNKQNQNIASFTHNGKVYNSYAK